MNKKLAMILAFGGAACLFALGACHKNESHSTSVYTSTNDPNPPRDQQQPADRSTTKDDWDFVQPQGQMVVDPK